MSRAQEMSTRQEGASGWVWLGWRRTGGERQAEGLGRGVSRGEGPPQSGRSHRGNGDKGPGGRDANRGLHPKNRGVQQRALWVAVAWRASEVSCVCHL